MEWKTIERPSYFGKKRDGIIAGYDEKYGKNNWRIAWQWKGDVISWLEACLIYEDGYFLDSYKRDEVWKCLQKNAKNVYDYEEKDIESGLDYTLQKAPGTHLQDIAIRRIFFRRGWDFLGDQLVRIRSVKTFWGSMLGPGKVDFHSPERIVEPHIDGWWKPNSIEDFYQSNKILQIKE